MSSLHPKKINTTPNKFTQLVNNIPDNSILAGVIKDKQINNTFRLPKELLCRLFPTKNLDTYTESQISAVSFLANRNRDFIIAELTPETKSRINKLLGNGFKLNPTDTEVNTEVNKLYLDWYGLSTDNYYDFIINKFNNWYFTPQIDTELAQKKQTPANPESRLWYITDKPQVNGIIINEPLTENDFICQLLEYLEISSAARIDNIWCMKYEQIIISFVDGGQEFLFYYNRY